MDLEAGIVLGVDGEVLYEHVPAGRTATSLPHCPRFWDAIWGAFEDGVLGGVAHSHPGRGTPSPSAVDLGTFAAIEAALDTRVHWWIARARGGALVRVDWTGPGRLDYDVVTSTPGPWLTRLRDLSKEDTCDRTPHRNRHDPRERHVRRQER